MGQWKKSSSTGTCPVTGGVPTRMTAAGFDKLCKVKMSEMRSEDSNHAHVEVRGLINKLNICSACRGKSRPAELEIITIEGNMATKLGLCEECGEKGLIVSMSHGVNLCSTCKTVHAHVNNRPETVIGAIKRLELVDRYVGDLVTDGVKATVDSQVMDRIAAAVGYEGTDGDGLVTAVEAMASSRSSIITAHILDADLLDEISEIMDSVPYNDGARPVGLVNAVRDLVEDRLARLDEIGQLRSVQIEPSPDVIRALGLPEGPTSWQTIELAAMRTAAMFEGNSREWAGTILGAQSQVEKLETELIRIREAIYGEWASDDTPVDLVAEVRKTVADLKKALDMVSESESELVRLRDSLEGPKLVAIARPAESYILDLALMALRGEITGLDPEFLGAMREAV